jgi:hypothetical protein
MRAGEERRAVVPACDAAARAAGLLLGYAADRLLGDPRRWRYERYGWASARLDDLLNLPAARLAGLLTLAASPARAPAAWRVWRRDAAAHPSPNAGVIEAAFAGTLGVRLGGTNVYYGNRVEHRAVMDGGRPAEPRDIPRAAALARRVGYGAAIAATVLAAIRGLIQRRYSGSRLMRRMLPDLPRLRADRLERRDHALKLGLTGKLRAPGKFRALHTLGIYLMTRIYLLPATAGTNAAFGVAAAPEEKEWPPA